MYQLTLNERIIRLSDGACIPQDESNTDYQTYLQWKADGNKPLPIEVIQIALEPQVEAVINQQLDDRARQVGYDNMLDACSFINSTNIIYRQDAKTLIALRDAVWVQYHSLQADVKANKIKLTTVDDWLKVLTTLNQKE